MIRSHADGYEVSATSLAKMLGWHRDTVSKALRELIAARWLAIRPYKTAEGNRVFDEYHVHASRKFTAIEAAEYSEPVVLGAGPAYGVGNPHAYGVGIPHAYGVGIPLPTEQAAPCLPDRHLPAYGVGTKEDQPEHQSEEQQENQAPKSELNCFGCRVLGRGCSIHVRRREPVSVGVSAPNWTASLPPDDDECPF